MDKGEWPIVLENDNGIRPAGKPDRCFYCNSKVGELHEKDCVMVEKTIKVRYVFEFEMSVPHFWDAFEFEFNRNEGRWCASNALTELENLAEKNNDCLCPFFRAEFIGEVDATPVRS